MFLQIGITLSSGIALMIHNKWQAAIAGGLSPIPSTDPKGKRARSPSPIKGEGKAKKSKGLSFHLDATLSSSKVLIVEAAAVVMVPPNLEVVALASTGEVLEGK